MLEIGFGFGRETTVAWKVTVREAPLLIVPRDIPTIANGLALLHNMFEQPDFEEAEAIERGADVTLITGPTNLTPPQNLKKLIKIESANDMYEAVLENLDENDVVIKSAAVADYKPKNYSNKKIKKEELENILQPEKYTGRPYLFKTHSYQKFPS